MQAATDFSTLSGTANTASPTAIAGFTWVGGEGNWNAVVTAGANPGGGGKYVRIANNASGLTLFKFMRWDTVGSLGANVDTELLALFRIHAFADAEQYCPLVIRHNGATQYYALNAPNVAATEQMQRFTGLVVSESVGNSITRVTTADAWFWSRGKVLTSSGHWSWKIWADGGAEPAYFSIGTADSVALTSGYVGFGTGNYTGLPMDVGFLSIGTAGDPALLPGESGAIVIPGSGVIVTKGMSQAVARASNF